MSESSAPFCLESDEIIELKVHSTNEEDTAWVFKQVCILCGVFTVLALGNFIVNIQEKTKTIESLTARLQFGEDNTYASKVSLLGSCLILVWHYLYFSIILDMTFVLSQYWYIFLTPLILLCGSICL